MARMNGIIFGQQNLWPKTFLPKKYLGQKQNLVQNIVWQKECENCSVNSNFWSQKILCQKIFGQKIVLIIFLVKNKFVVELFLVKKNCQKLLVQNFW